MDFEGFSNWDTWEAYNLIQGEPDIREEISIIATEANVRYFKTIIREALTQFYEKYPFDRDLQVNLHAINYLELKNAFANFGTN